MKFGDLKVQMIIYRAYLRGYRLPDNIDRQCLCKNVSNCQVVQAATELAFALGVTDRTKVKEIKGKGGDTQFVPNPDPVKERPALAALVLKHLELPDGEDTEVEHK